MAASASRRRRSSRRCGWGRNSGEGTVFDPGLRSCDLSWMRYIDSGERQPQNALGYWLSQELNENVAELRVQSGFFSAEGLTPFVETLHRMRGDDLPVRLIVGSNDGGTLRSHVSHLVDLVGVPRAAARLGVISYQGGYFHPKTYHLRRRDGTESAYVGSANLTMSGIASTHIEAGILLDTAQGDAAETLTEVAAAVDAWFKGDRAGIEIVNDLADVERLGEAGVLSEVRPPRPPKPARPVEGPRPPPRPRLEQLIQFAPFGRQPLTTIAPLVLSRPSAPRSPPFPPYVLFDPGARIPTQGTSALSGSALPGGASGLIIRLSRDSARHWRGGRGTANISIPVPTVPTLRFGLYRRRYERPRAEFGFEIQYIGTRCLGRSGPAETNVMVYGFAPDEAGHGDVRLVVSAGPAREISQFAQAQGYALPLPGDAALLEWPTDEVPVFTLSLIERGSPLFQQATALLAVAGQSNQMVGQGACWLPPGLAPAR
jgi:NgoFVII restriction endonuclease